MAVEDSTGGERVTIVDALMYVKDLKQTLENERWKYYEFISILRDFKAERINTEVVVAQVNTLLEGHGHLILGFNTFLPESYRTVPTPKNKLIKFGEALSFVNRVKARFQNVDHTYETFLEILAAHRNNKKSTQEVYSEVSMLFQNHQDLFEDFISYVPEELRGKPTK